MPGLLDWDIDPAELSAMAQNAGTPTWTPGGAAPDADPNGGTMAATLPIAAPAASGSGFWGKAGSVIGDIGSALGGGLDPSITGEAAGIAGRRALLNFSLQMLANSGPSYTPRNFGQILASGLDAAGQSNRYTEEARLKGQQVNATLALKLGQQQIQNYLATITGAKAAKELGVANRVSAAATGAGGGTAPAAGDTVPPAGGGAAPASAGDFVRQNAPVFADIAQRTGLPVEFLVGQAANESDWGRSPAATEGFNLFGVSKDNKPVRYASQQEASDAYVSLLNNRYANVPRTGTPAEIGGALGKAGYNTVVPDYGQRVGNFATQATPFLPRPAGTKVAGPGAGTSVPSGGAAPSAPSSTPPSPDTGAAAPPAAAPLIPRVTLPPPDFSDIPGRRAAVKTAYEKELANVADSGDPQLRAQAEEHQRTANAAIDTEVANRKAGHADKAADFEAKQNEAEAKLAQQKADAVAERQNKVDLANIAADQARLTNKDQTINQANLDGLKQVQKEQLDARDVVTQLRGFRALSDGVGQPGWMQTTTLPGSNATIAERLQQMGLKTDDTAGVQLLRGGINGIVKSLRQGMAMGTLSDRDLNFIERMGPTEWMDQDTRAAAVGYLEQAYMAKQKFASDVQKEMSRGRNFGDAIDAADKYQAPFVPTVPRDLTEHWTDPAWQQQRIEWAQQYGVRPGTLFHLNNGRVIVMKGQRASQGER